MIPRESPPPLFAPPVPPRDPNVVPSDRKRLAGQNAVILDMLREGPRTNDELNKVSRKYTSRTSDCRKAGYNILCTPLGGGLNLYTLLNP